jgi:spoIIIJ-associated protein
MSTQTESSVVIEGKNVEEALQAACDRLNTTPNQVEYEIVEEGRSGVLGFLKGKTVKIKVWGKSETERMISDMVKTLFNKMQLNVQARVSRGEDAYEIDLETSDSDGLLIGRGGDTLKSLQHLISRMVGHQDENVRVRVDVAGYRKRRHEQLCRKAKDLADRALSSGRDMMTEPLPADERRIVHLTLADDDRVETRAVGEGQIKRVAVCTVGGRSGSQRGRRGGSDRGDRGDRRPRRSNGRGDSRDSRDSRDDRPRGGSRSAPDNRRDGEREERRPRSHGGRDDNRRPQRGGRRPERSERPERTRTPREDAPARAAEPRRTEPPKPQTESSESTPKRTIPIKESYFNIPDTFGAKEPDNTKEVAKEDAPLTFGRKRRPSRGRR